MLALVINPVAGIGGPAGLKGSDGVADLAYQRGGRSRAQHRAQVALGALVALLGGDVAGVLTGGGAMGADAARAAGVRPIVVHEPAQVSSAVDTAQLVRAAVAAGAELVLFVGGDGTARDVAAAVAGSGAAVLGVPAGVKMYSSCFAVSPAAAGARAAAWVRGDRSIVAAEVLDVDEQQVRAGRVAVRLFGSVPVARGRTQARKAPAGGDATAAAAGVVAQLRPGVAYVLGPGSTTAAVAELLGLSATLLGVDVVRDGALVCADASERELLEVLDGGPAQAVVTIIGGQGFVLGRGNQQLSPAVLARLGDPPLLVVADEAKVAALAGAPLLLDSGDADLDNHLAGYTRVVTGVAQTTMYRMEPAGGMDS